MKKVSILVAEATAVQYPQIGSLAAVRGCSAVTCRKNSLAVVRSGGGSLTGHEFSRAPRMPSSQGIIASAVSSKESAWWQLPHLCTKVEGRLGRARASLKPRFDGIPTGCS